MKTLNNKIKVFSIILAMLCGLIAGCSTASKTQKGASIGAGAGATVGALIGKAAGNTALGTIIGGAIGGTAGAYIGQKMDQVGKFNTEILFDPGSADIHPDDQAKLHTLAVNMRNNPQVKVSITGYTDSLGVAFYNMALSVKRAEAVKTALVADSVSADHLTTEGKGSSEQIATNTTREGRQKNRRVEIAIIAKK